MENLLIDGLNIMLLLHFTVFWKTEQSTLHPFEAICELSQAETQFMIILCYLFWSQSKQLPFISYVEKVELFEIEILLQILLIILLPHLKLQSYRLHSLTEKLLLEYRLS